jgi:hypothetical protein
MNFNKPLGSPISRRLQQAGFSFEAKGEGDRATATIWKANKQRYRGTGSTIEEALLTAAQQAHHSRKE